jgi:hypothetical protein
MHAFGRRPSLVKPSLGQRTLRADDDKRFAPRRAGRAPALITFDGAHESIPCFILDMSTTGARLELRKEAGNPFLSRWTNVDRIWVVVRSDRVMYDCSIVRRDDTELGVRFMAAPKAVTRFSR